MRLLHLVGEHNWLGVLRAKAGRLRLDVPPCRDSTICSPATAGSRSLIGSIPRVETTGAVVLRCLVIGIRCLLLWRRQDLTSRANNAHEEPPLVDVTAAFGGIHIESPQPSGRTQVISVEHPRSISDHL